MADDLAKVLDEQASSADVVVGMSLGGMVANALASARPDLVKRLLVVDVTPGVTAEKAKHIHEFISGPPDFPSFSEIFDRTVEYNPTRSESSLRRGIIHNARRQPGGRWTWVYDRRGRAEDAPAFDRQALWDDIALLPMPYLLARGGGEGSLVDDDDVDELERRRPDAQIVTVSGAGHSIQGDKPRELAALIVEFAVATGASG